VRELLGEVVGRLLGGLPDRGLHLLLKLGVEIAGQLGVNAQESVASIDCHSALPLT